MLLLAAVTAAFLLLPWRALDLDDTVLITAVFFIGLAGAAALIVWQVIAYRDAKMSGRSPSPRGLSLRSMSPSCSSSP